MKLQTNHITTPSTVEEYRRIYVKALRLGIAFERAGQIRRRESWTIREWEQYRNMYPNIIYAKSIGGKEVLVRGNRSIRDGDTMISPSEFLSRMGGNMPPKGNITLIHKLI